MPNRTRRRRVRESFAAQGDTVDARAQPATGRTREFSEKARIASPIRKTGFPGPMPSFATQAALLDFARSRDAERLRKKKRSFAALFLGDATTKTPALGA